MSWFQGEPTVSLELVAHLGVERSAAVIDVGGGASPLVDHLVAAGFGDVTVLDVSVVALEEARRRVGPHAPVRWVGEDLLAWHPSRRYGLWHDRAVFHFLVDDADRARYVATLTEALEDGAGVVMATFAPDGPEYCSGLPVCRYSPEALAAALGPGFTLVASRRELHTTPAGVAQPFTWIAGRMAGRGVDRSGGDGGPQHRTG